MSESSGGLPLRPGRLMSACSVCDTPQKPVFLVQASSAPRNFSGAVAAHLEALRSLLIMEHESCVKTLQTDNRQLRDKLQAVDSAVQGGPAVSGAQPKVGGPKAHTADDAGGVMSRLSPLSSFTQQSPGRLGANESKDDSQEVLTQGLRKALEELRGEAVGIKREMQDASSLCADVIAACAEMPKVHPNSQGQSVVAPFLGTYGRDAEADALIHNQDSGARSSTDAEEPASPDKFSSPDKLHTNNSRVSTLVSAVSRHSSVNRSRSRDKVAAAKKPQAEQNRLQRLVNSNSFELGSGLVILLNTFFMALQLQYDGFDAGFDLNFNGYRSSKDTWPSADTMFYVVNVIFNALFTIELLMRFAVMGRSALYSAWMYFDTFIVSLGLADFVANEVAEGGLGMDPAMIRVARLIRLVRMLKVFKTMTAFDSLFLLIKSIHASFNALVWSFLLLLSVQITTGMFLCQLLNGYIVDKDENEEHRQKVFEYFGTFTRTMLTMFEITLANWVPSCRALVEYVGEYYMIFYILYRCMFCFAVLKVIAAVFITETNRVLASDDELTILKSRRERTQYKRKLLNVFNEMDLDGDGMLDFEELKALLADDYMVSWLSTLGFEVHDFQKIFASNDAMGEGLQIDIEGFLDKAGKAKGQAKTIDILGIMQQLTDIQVAVDSLSKKTASGTSRTPGYH